VVHVYKMSWTVEQSFRTGKSIVETRPIYHQSDQATRGHVFCSSMALTLKAELERRLKVAEAAGERVRVLRGLESLSFDQELTNSWCLRWVIGHHCTCRAMLHFQCSSQ
jgi:hypothetical protein